MLKLYQIKPNQLFLRGRFFDASVDEKDKLLDTYGIRVIVNLISRKDHYLASRPALFYLHSPMPDSENADFQVLERTVAVAADLLRKGFPVLAHCNAGRNRSALFCAMMLMDVYGMTVVESVDWMRAYRRNSLATQAFVEYLQKRTVTV